MCPDYQPFFYRYTDTDISWTFISLPQCARHTAAYPHNCAGVRLANLRL